MTYSEIFKIGDKVEYRYNDVIVIGKVIDNAYLMHEIIVEFDTRFVVPSYPCYNSLWSFDKHGYIHINNDYVKVLFHHKSVEDKVLEGTFLPLLDEV